MIASNTEVHRSDKNACVDAYTHIVVLKYRCQHKKKKKIGADVAKRQKKKKKWIQYTVVHWNPSFSYLLSLSMLQ